MEKILYRSIADQFCQRNFRAGGGRQRRNLSGINPEAMGVFSLPKLEKQTEDARAPTLAVGRCNDAL